MSHDVFISYSSKDKTIADAVCAKLEERKIRCWVAPRDISAGQNFAESIIDAIDNCQVFVLVWSANTNTSEHILNELNQAFDQAKPIIPFRIQEVEPTKAMRYYFGRTHWLDALTPPLEKHIRTLADTILAILASRSAAAPQAPLAAAKVDIAASVPEPARQVITPAPVELDKPQILEPSPKKQREPRPERPRKEPKPKPERSKKTRRPITLPKIEKPILVPVLAGTAFLAILALLYFTGTFNLLSEKIKPNAPRASSTNIATITKTTKTITPPPTLRAATPTSAPTWIREFSEPILAAIKNIPPDFQDDFVYLKKDWSLEDRRNELECSHTYSEVFDGRLFMTADGNSGKGCWTWAHQQSMGFHNVVVSYEVSFREGLGSGSLTMLDQNNSEISPSTTFTLSKDGSWYYDFCSEKTCILEESGMASVDPSKMNLVTLIIYNDRTAVYLNSSPLQYFVHQNQELSDPSQFAFTVQSYDQHSYTVEFDNLKIWNLDKLGTYRDGVFTPYPAWLEPVLASIEDRPPDFKDDFSSLKQDWLLENLLSNPKCANTTSVVSNGVVRMVADTNKEGGCWTWARLPNIALQGTYVQVDVNLKESNSEGQLILEDSSGHFISFTLSHDGEWSIQSCSKNANNIICPYQESGFTSSYRGQPDTIRLISYGQNVAVWLNSTPLGFLNTQNQMLIAPVHFALTVQNDDRPTNIVEFDNISIWNLE